MSHAVSQLTLLLTKTYDVPGFVDISIPLLQYLFPNGN